MAIDGKDRPSPRVNRLARFGLNTANRRRLANFYENAFGCRSISQKRCSGADFERRMNVRGGAECLTWSLGSSIIEVLEFDTPGRPCLPDLSPYDSEFQHFAIVVADMNRAFERLSSIDGWSAISTSGPQRLPDASDNVTAFKFRDPDGHPLELLAFAPAKTPRVWRADGRDRPFLGIDHSAVSVLDTRRSTAFYECLGLKVMSETLNHGIEQQLLDGLSNPLVDVIALTPVCGTPHVELLGYRSDARRARPPLLSNDIAATRLIFETDGASSEITGRTVRLLRDPDGHYIQVGP